MLRELIHDYLNEDISRRAFVARLSNWGFSLAAATSILNSLAPLARAESPTPDARVVEGTGGALLVEQLRAAGVRFLFNCNSSGTAAIFDALVDRPDMQPIHVPQEGQMIAVAQGYALASGKTAFTLNGSVGFPNTLNNMYNAWKDRTPIVVGSQRESRAVHGGRDAFEEWDDYLGPSASFTRWRWSIEQPERIPEFTRRAFKIAATPPYGPVALAFPEDALTARGLRSSVLDLDKFVLTPKIAPTPSLVEDAARLLVDAKNPVLLVGAEVTRADAKAAVVALAERLALPVAQAERLFDDFPTDHPLFVGEYGPAMRHPADVDLVLNLGARLPDEQRTFPSSAKLVHVSIDPDAIGRVVATELGIVADVKETATALVAAVGAVATRDRLERIRSARFGPTATHSAMQRAQQEHATRAKWDARPLSWERVTGELARLLDADAVIVPELADHTWENAPWYWEGEFVFAPGARSKIGRTTGSALGWGVGAAIGVKLAWPDRQVVALQGDGGFMFAQAESLWTMARYEVPVIVVIFNNRSYNGPRNKTWAGGGRQAQADQDMTCYLGDPDVDFAKVASGFGVAAEVVTAPEQVEPAVKRAIRSTRDGKPYLIDAVIARTGRAAASTWHPKYSVASARNRAV